MAPPLAVAAAASRTDTAIALGTVNVAQQSSGRHAPEPKEEGRMEYIGAGLAALGVIGPGIGIGILTGMAATAIGRNPDAAPTIRAQFILGAAFAEGLGVLAIVVAILAIVLSRQPQVVFVDLFAIGGIAPGGAIAAAAEAGEAAGLQINVFWIIVSALNFIVLLVILSISPSLRSVECSRSGEPGSRRGW